MELIACNFEFFPVDSAVRELLDPVLNRCTEVRFPYSIGERNSNQFTFDFDSKLKEKLLECGGTPAALDLPPEILKEYDFTFSFGGKMVVVEVEKANRDRFSTIFLSSICICDTATIWRFYFFARTIPIGVENGIYTTGERRGISNRGSLDLARRPSLIAF